MSPSTEPNKLLPLMAAAWRPAAAIAASAVALVGALVGYALLSNWLMVHAANQAVTVALLFGPLLLAVAAQGWRQRQWLTLVACAALLLLLVAVVLQGGVANAQRLYVLQHGGIHLALAWTFGLTLRGGEKALITGLAEGLHSSLNLAFTPALARYTRSLTMLWAGYFFAMVPVSAGLYLLAPWPWWSFYCTVLTPLSAAALFVAEYLWRYQRHPGFPRVTMRAAFDAYQQSGRIDKTAAS
jgi:uncharacterized membrane protein